MKLHFRYHHIVFCNKIKRLNKYCKYCQDWHTTTAANRNVWKIYSSPIFFQFSWVMRTFSPTYLAGFRRTIHNQSVVWESSFLEPEWISILVIVSRPCYKIDKNLHHLFTRSYFVLKISIKSVRYSGIICSIPPL